MENEMSGFESEIDSIDASVFLSDVLFNDVLRKSLREHCERWLRAITEHENNLVKPDNKPQLIYFEGIGYDETEDEYIGTLGIRESYTEVHIEAIKVYHEIDGTVFHLCKVIEGIQSWDFVAMPDPDDCFTIDNIYPSGIAFVAAIDMTVNNVTQHSMIQVFGMTKEICELRAKRIVHELNKKGAK
jgi:hypothetical protein